VATTYAEAARDVRKAVRAVGRMTASAARGAVRTVSPDTADGPDTAIVPQACRTADQARKKAGAGADHKAAADTQAGVPAPFRAGAGFADPIVRRPTNAGLAARSGRGTIQEAALGRHRPCRLVAADNSQLPSPLRDSVPRSPVQRMHRRQLPCTVGMKLTHHCYRTVFA
jgi:hypothetical protein